MIGLCMGFASALWAQLPHSDFTLAWQHSVERIRWEEDYRLDGEGLHLGEARVRGSGAGMEIPDGAVLRDGSWHYRRDMPPLKRLRVGRSGFGGDYQLCFAGQCDPLARWLGPVDATRPVLELWACETASITPDSSVGAESADR